MHPVGVIFFVNRKKIDFSNRKMSQKDYIQKKEKGKTFSFLFFRSYQFAT